MQIYCIWNSRRGYSRFNLRYARDCLRRTAYMGPSACAWQPKETPVTCDVAPLMTHQCSINWRHCHLKCDGTPHGFPQQRWSWWRGNRLIFSCASALPVSPCVLADLDEQFMGRLYVPKPPKKRSDCVAKSKIIARAVFGALSTSKILVPVASRQISRVCSPSISPWFSLLTPFLIHRTLFDMRGPMLRNQPLLTAQDWLLSRWDRETRGTWPKRMGMSIPREMARGGQRSPGLRPTPALGTCLQRPWTRA